MNKKLIAAAIAAGLAAPMAAQADITAYAQVQFEITQTDPDAGDSEISVNDNERGRFGLKGGHDLGDGLKAFAKVEFDLVGGNADSEFASGDRGDIAGTPSQTDLGNASRIREANAGLQGDFGKFTIGTMKSAYKYTGGVKYDPFVTTNIEARRNGGMSRSVYHGSATAANLGQNGFISNAIAYENSFGGASVWLTYSPDESNNQDGEYTFAAMYQQKGWEAFVSAAGSGGDTATGAVDYTATKVGGQWNSGGHKISAQYEMTTFKNDPQGDDDVDIMFIGYQMKMGNNILVAQLGQEDPDVSDGTDYYALGVIHKFNKMVRIYGGYGSSEVDNVETTRLTAGLRVDY